MQKSAERNTQENKFYGMRSFFFRVPFWKVSGFLLLMRRKILRLRLGEFIYRVRSRAEIERYIEGDRQIREKMIDIER